MLHQRSSSLPEGSPDLITGQDWAWKLEEPSADVQTAVVSSNPRELQLWYKILLITYKNSRWQCSETKLPNFSPQHWFNKINNSGAEESSIYIQCTWYWIKHFIHLWDVKLKADRSTNWTERGQRIIYISYVIFYCWSYKHYREYQNQTSFNKLIKKKQN